MPKCSSLKNIDSKFFNLILEVPVLADGNYQVYKIMRRLADGLYDDHGLRSFDKEQQADIFQALSEMDFCIGIKYLLELVSIVDWKKGKVEQVQGFLEDYFQSYEAMNKNYSLNLFDLMVSTSS